MAPKRFPARLSRPFQGFFLSTSLEIYNCTPRLGKNNFTAENVFPNLMIMAPWLTHLSITFLFSGSDGVSFGPPGISTCVIDSCHYITLLFSLPFSPGRYRQSAHGTRRQDDHCGSEQAPCQRGSHLASTLNPGRYNLSMFLPANDKPICF